MSFRIKTLLVSLAPLLSVAALLAQNADPRLIDAVKRGDEESLRSLLKQGANVNQKQPDGATALAWAVHRDDVKLADLLIRAGADVNAVNDYRVAPLSIACDNGNSTMVEFLLAAKANPNTATWTGETALMTCAHRGNLAAVQSLLARKANVNAAEGRHGQTALMWAVADAHPEIARALIEHGADLRAETKREQAWAFATYDDGTQEMPSGGYTALHFAVRHDAVEPARVLLDAGANVNQKAADGMTPLLLAEANGYEQLAIFLIEKGADPKSADPNGVTALHYSIRQGLGLVTSGGRGSGPARNMRDLVKVILDRGADPNARLSKPPARIRLVGAPRLEPEGATPLLLAAASRDLSLMKMLLAAGANPNLTTADNTNALMLAVGFASPARVSKEQEKNILEIARLLVDLGNDVNAINTNDERMINGKTAVHAATYLGMDSVIQFLAEKGARVTVPDRCGETPLNIALGDPALLRYSTERIRGGYKSTADLLRKLGGDVPVGKPEVPCVLLAGIHARFSSPSKKINYKPDGAEAQPAAKPQEAN